MRKMMVVASLAVLVGCHREHGDQAKQTRRDPVPKTQTRVPYDPAFKRIQGSWRSEPGAANLGADRFLQIDVASNGGYSIDVRERQTKDHPLTVVQSARGKASATGGGIVGTLAPKSVGPDILAISPWRASTDSDGRSMSLKGADGRVLNLTRE